jgi:Trk K+ transport system NAD-binding subunit
MNPAYSNVLILASMVLNPDVYSITPDVDETQEVREIKLQNRYFINRRLTDLNLPDEVTVLMIERGGNSLVPDQETSLQANDTITLVGIGNGVDEVARLFARDGR